MSSEVIVVGAGIGGLTTAALLAARGVDVCVYERNDFVGGCVANFEYSGYSFEPTAGLYAGWEPSGIHQRIFSELRIDPPEVRRVSPAFVVRLSDQTDVTVSDDLGQLAEAFPECADAAVSFYRELGHSNPTNQHGLNFPAGSSARFREFIDIQLQFFAQRASERCDPASAASALLAPQRGLSAIRGGAQALADVLADSIRKNGGAIKLNSPVLRLAFSTEGLPSGVDLLSGERVSASRSIVSNLTVWDTYGKLIGLNRTPPDVRAYLKSLHSRGAYLMLLGLDDSGSERLSAGHLLATDQDSAGSFLFAAAPDWDRRAPEGKRAVTVCTLTDAEDWFTFHEDQAESEERDQRTLEGWWARLHSVMPELGAGIEVIETVTPRTYYERTRRKFGMIGHPVSDLPQVPPNHQTVFPNLFIVGDTVGAGWLEGISDSALALADAIMQRPPQ